MAKELGPEIELVMNDGNRKCERMDDPSLMPDLSHLSAEEREIIEQVFKRQKDEEAKEVQLTQ
ncbi:hypothetical protein COOONC_03167 [Cooperia oncophora]